MKNIEFLVKVIISIQASSTTSLLLKTQWQKISLLSEIVSYPRSWFSVAVKCLKFIGIYHGQR